jgi:hypothetical protein
MTLDETLLQKLADWRPDTTRQTLTVEHAASGWIVEVTADRVETVGARLWEVALRRSAPLSGPASLAEQAGEIAARVTGLLEPLRLVEVDAGLDLAQLRSDAPAARGEELSYYEVVRQGDGTTHVRRYLQGPGGKRQQVAFTLTLDALGKLVADLASA